MLIRWFEPSCVNSEPEPATAKRFVMSATVFTPQRGACSPLMGTAPSFYCGTARTSLRWRARPASHRPARSCPMRHPESGRASRYARPRCRSHSRARCSIGLQCSRRRALDRARKNADLHECVDPQQRLIQGDVLLRLSRGEVGQLEAGVRLMGHGSWENAMEPDYARQEGRG